MTGRRQHRILSLLTHAVIAGSVLSAVPFSAVAQDVVLNPGFISGTVRVGDEVLTRADVSASGAGSSSSTNVAPPAADPTSASYTLTVNVPEGTSPTYNVNATARLDGFRDTLQFASESVTVDEGATTIADFIVANPGFVQADVVVSGGTVSSLSLDIRRSNGSLPRSFTSGSTTVPANVAVVPGTGLRVITRVSLTNGFQIAPPDRIIDVAAGQTVVLDYDLTAPTDTGTIAGTIAMPGPVEPQRHDVGASGPSSKSVVVLQDGAYALEDLLAGTYNLSATTRFNNFQDTFSHPPASFQPGRQVTVGTGTTSTVNISSEQAFIEGSIDISGSASPSDLSSGSISAFGASGSDAQGASASGRVDSGTAAYDLIVSEGSWSINSVNLSFFRSDLDDFLSQSLFFRDFVLSQNAIPVAAGATASQDLELAVGKVTVTLQIEGGGTFSNPTLSGSCQLRNSSNQLLSSSSFSSGSSGQNNVSVGEVSFVAPEGTCTVTARATVGGSNVTFGQFTIDVEPGTDQVVDLGGPSLTVEFPEPNFMTAADSITVTGRATDDVAVAGVTVNGVAASIASTGNLDDPNEISFSATIPLERGPNQVSTVASDTADPPNSSSNSRTVFRDEAPPLLSWTPEDDAQVPATGPSTSVSISGTADDDAGVDSILVEGASVAFTSTGNGNEVRFTTSLGLPVGTNFVEVVATDISNRATAQTHEITVTENRPPVADAGGPYTVDEGGSVGLDASGSSDPDADDLTFAWDLDQDGAFDDASGAGATFDASSIDGPDARTVRVEVSDGDHTTVAEATVQIGNVAPALGPVAVTPSPADVGDTVTVSANFTDPIEADGHSATIDFGDGASVGGTISDGKVSATHTYGSGGAVTLTVTVTDDDGGGDSATASLTVIANQPPVADAGGPYGVAEGSSVALDAGASSDPDGDLLAFAWDLDGDGDFDDGTGPAPTFDARAIDGPATVTVAVRVSDGELTREAAASVSVANVAPIVVAGGDQTAREGDTVSLGATFADPGAADSHTVSVDWGDGTSGSSLGGSHTYADDGTFTVTVAVTDDDGGTGQDSLQVLVTNVAPSLGPLSGPVDPVAVGQQVTVTAEVTDPGQLDTHSVEVNWGDGTNDAGTISSPASASHVYDTPGIYTVMMTVSDDDGGSVSGAYQYVVAYDPSGSFVTGGGHIASPPGAYLPDPTLAGRATFGFVSKYQKGASQPSGNTEFQFQAGDLNFRSTTYDWLVVAGAQAKFKGEGRINGAGNYGFQLFARDSAITGGGTNDAFRIKIWEKATDAVVYDNELGAADDADPTSALTGGSIVIHEAKGGGKK